MHINMYVSTKSNDRNGIDWAPVTTDLLIDMSCMDENQFHISGLSSEIAKIVNNTNPLNTEYNQL